MVMEDRSSFEDKGAYVVQRSPAEPDFWFGNQLIYREMRPRDEMLRAFSAEFPDAAHMVLSFDRPGLAPPGWAGADTGFEVDLCDTLALDGPIRGPAMPAGLTFRQIETDADWAAVVGLQTEIGIEQGYDGPRHAPFVQARFAALRARAQNRADLAWFGVFDGPLLVADMGIVWSSALARYQNVETRRSHRGRGICAALLVAAHAHAATRAPKARFVIVADTDGPPGRLYRRAGFGLVEVTLAVYRPGY